MSDHVVINANLGGAFECQHCGETYLPTYPIAILDMSALARSFEGRHARCRDPRKEAHHAAPAGNPPPSRDGAVHTEKTEPGAVGEAAPSEARSAR